VASLFTDSLVINTIILKLLIVLTEILGAVFLIKTLNLLNINVSRIWFLFLNPLWIIECTGNTHFEGVMISFLFIAFFFLIQKKETLGSIFFAIAVQIKLVPLLLLPFFLQFLGWKKAIVLYTLTILIVFTLGLLQLNGSNIYNFIDSLRLYFEAFEFNSFALYYYIQYGYWDTGWNLTKVYAPRLSVIALMIIVSLSLYGGYWCVYLRND
jgi:Gpi18-like mannosyltransferase